MGPSSRAAAAKILPSTHGCGLTSGMGRCRKSALRLQRLASHADRRTSPDDRHGMQEICDHLQEARVASGPPHLAAPRLGVQPLAAHLERGEHGRPLADGAHKAPPRALQVRVCRAGAALIGPAWAPHHLLDISSCWTSAHSRACGLAASQVTLHCHRRSASSAGPAGRQARSQRAQAAALVRALWQAHVRTAARPARTPVPPASHERRVARPALRLDRTGYVLPWQFLARLHLRIIRCCRLAQPQRACAWGRASRACGVSHNMVCTAAALPFAMAHLVQVSPFSALQACRPAAAFGAGSGAWARLCTPCRQARGPRCPWSQRPCTG